MICNIRGTSGSGKSTLVRKIMDMGSIEPVLQAAFSSRSRPNPLGYWLTLPGLKKRIYVVGHYETATGGCDTVGSVGPSFSCVRDLHKAGHHVLFEGLLISRSKGRMIELWDGLGQSSMKAFHLELSLEECFAGIAARRAAVGNLGPVNPAQTTATYARVLQISNSFRQSGYPIQFVTRGEAVNRILEAFYSDEGVKIHVRANSETGA